MKILFFTRQNCGHLEHFLLKSSDCVVSVVQTFIFYNQSPGRDCNCNRNCNYDYSSTRERTRSHRVDTLFLPLDRPQNLWRTIRVEDPRLDTDPK